MKKLFLLSTIAVLFFSCKKDVTTAKKQDDRQSKGAGIETASIIHLETDIPVSYENYVCNGEIINFTGNIQVTYKARGNDENTMGIQQVTTTLKGVSRNGAIYNVMESSQNKTIITSKDFVDNHAVTGPYFEQVHGNGSGLYKYLLVYQYNSLSQKITVTIQDFQLICGG